MSRHWCPSLEQFTPASLHFGSPGGLKMEKNDGEEEEEEERSPIYSLSKSSMDIVMATKRPHLRDPAWAKLDLRRSANQNTQSFPNSNALQLRPLQQYRQHHTPQTQPNASRHIHQHEKPLRSECVERWSVCSVCSCGSTPETVIWKGGASRPCSMTEETLRVPFNACRFESQSSVQIPVTPSPFTSPLNTSSNSPVIHTCHPLHEFRPSPLTTNTHCQSHQSAVLNVRPICQPSPNTNTQPLGVGLGSPIQMQEAELDSPVFLPTSYPPAHMDMPWVPRHTCQAGRAQGLGGLVFSFSDSQLYDYAQCCCNSTHSGVMNMMTLIPQGSRFREEGTMTSQRQLVDVGVQTRSPLGSLQSTLQNPGSDNNLSHLSPHRLCHIYTDSNSDLSSQSILGSPPGSRLNLKSALGSHSNLVSPSSSMFTPDSPRDELEAAWEKTGDIPHGETGRRKSCLKVEVGEDSGSGGHSKRRNSMKQVQWDKDGQTWDVYGASLEPEELSSAIQKHLQLKTSTDNLTTEACEKTKVKSRVRIMSRSKFKTKTHLMQTATTSTNQTGTTSTDKKTNTEIAYLPRAAVNTAAAVATENEVYVTKDRQQGDRGGEKEGYDYERGKRKMAKAEIKGERNEEVNGQEREEGGQRGDEDEEDGTMMPSNELSSRESERSRKKSGRVMRSLRRCIHSSNPTD
ncbi:hypothetical protein DPEC_G00330260 [Dallia pectoralis]|uniref:Uncharacterized protein n=1 Tax=Dallia pectoralis TaxID=75939 RepID=A0ACC2F919_DALPE|nr:hypothetical protein DPEC_G00330260 [Dallia pectoralis]